MKKASGEFVVTIRSGIDARASVVFVATANMRTSKIEIACDGELVDGKDIMGIMMLAAGQGRVIQVNAYGDDAEEAVQQIGDLIKSDFGPVGEAKKREEERCLEDGKGGSDAKQQSDKEWLRDPPIPGFSSNLLEPDPGTSILSWFPWFSDPSLADTITEGLQKAGLTVYRCPLHRIHASRLNAGFYAVLVTDCTDGSFIRTINERDPRLQVVIYAGNPYVQSVAKEHLQGLHVSAVVAIPAGADELVAPVRDVALPRYQSNIIPGDQDIVVLHSASGLSPL